MKKNVVLITIISSMLALVSAFVYASKSDVLLTKAGPEPDHTVYLTAQNSIVTPGTYNSSEYAYPISISRSNAFEDRAGNEWSMTSYDDITFTNFMCSGTGITFNGDYLITFVSEGWENLCVTFGFKDALFDKDASFIAFYYNDTNHYDNSAKFEFLETDGDYDYYYAEASFYDHYGDTIMIKEVKLVFDCI